MEHPNGSGVRQGPTALAAGAGEGYLDIFASSIISFFFLSDSGHGLIFNEMLSQRVIKPKTTNKQIKLSQPLQSF